MASRITNCLALAIFLIGASNARAEDGCIACHIDEEMDEKARRPAIEFNAGSHAGAGLSCADCHGGNRDSSSFLKAHSKRDGFRKRPGDAEIVSICGKCHDDADRMKESVGRGKPIGQAKQFEASTHGRIRAVEGFELPTCISCHGSHGIRPPTDPESRVHPTRVPDTCARCHSDLAYMRAFTSARVRVDQLIEYRTSVHGIRLAEGDVKVAVCSSCHSAHDIRPPTDPNSKIHPMNVAKTCGHCHSDASFMKGYRIKGAGGEEHPIPTDQLEKFRASVHHEVLMEKGDLSAPTCNDCHGNHGATPPEVRTVSNVCAQCHSRPAELFLPSALKEKLDGLGYKACATCHGHHGVQRPDDGLLEMISEGTTRSGWVPDPADAGTAGALLDVVRRLEASIERVEARAETVESYGMDLTRARLKLNRARDKLIQALVIVHAFQTAKMDEIVEGDEDEPGGIPLVAQAESMVEAALDERTFRRAGLAVALGIIALLIVALVLKIRQMEAT